jgi:hypothetical protein
MNGRTVGRRSRRRLLRPGVTLAALSVCILAIAGSAQVALATGCGQPDHLAFTGQPPTNLKLTDSFSVSVTVFDACGGVVKGAKDQVSLVLNAPVTPGGGALSPAAPSVQPASGVATFTGLQITATGTLYTLTASSGSLSPVASTPVSVFNFFGSCANGCGTSDSSGDSVTLQLPTSLSGNAGVALNAVSVTCGSSSSLGPIFIVQPPARSGSDPFDIPVTLVISRFYVNTIGVANIVVCKNNAQLTLSQLPKCPKKGAPTTACVVSQNADNAGNGLIRIRINSKDPFGGGFG